MSAHGRHRLGSAHWLVGLTVAACLAALIAGATVATTAASGSGCSTTWNGSAWSNGTPTSTSDVCVSGPLVLTGTPTWSTVTVESTGALRIGGEEACPGASDSLTLSNGGSIVSGGELDIFSSSSCSGGGPGALTVSSGTLTNAGVLDLTSCTTIGGSTCSGGSRTLTGNVTNTGTTNMSGTSPSLQGGTFDNEGTIDIGGGTSGVVDVSGGGTLLNRGTVAIDPNGSLGLGVDGGGTYDQQGSGTVTGQDVSVQGGTLDIEGAGAASFDILDPSTLEGNVYAGQTITTKSGSNGCSAAGDLTATGSFTNAGTINVDQSNCTEAKLILPSGATMTNTGTLTTLDCQCGGREIDGSILNQGTIEFGDRTSIVGSGTTFTQTAGSTTVANVTDLTRGPGTMQLQGGTLTGINSPYGPEIKGSIANTGGTVGTDGAGHELIVQGSYTQGQSGTLTDQIGPTAGNPTLNVQGDASLNGTLDIVTPSGVTPSSTATYPVLFGAVTGTFASVHGQFPSPGTGYAVSYTPNAVDVNVASSHTLTVEDAGTGAGTVVSQPDGINCGSTCSAQFLDGQTVQLLAQPASGSTFAGWSGGCTGSATTCQVTMSADTTVTASFAGGTPPPPAGAPPAPAIAPGSLHFGGLVAGHQATSEVTFTAAPGSPLQIGHVALSQASPFTVTADGCSGRTLAAGTSCTVGVTFSAPAHPSRSGETLTALLVASDDGGSGQQVVLVDGQDYTLGVISGTVTESGTPVSARVYACKTGGQTCVQTTSAADGSYQVGPLAAGRWSLQVTPSDPTQFVPAEATVLVDYGSVARQDFAVQPPISLGGHASLLSPTGQTSQGMPTINWQSPYSLTLPVPISGTGAPNSTEFLTDVGGVVGTADNFSPGRVYLQEAILVMPVHYGPDGRVDLVGDPLLGNLNCGPVDHPSAACMAIAAATNAGVPGGQRATAGRAASRASGTKRPIAHAAGVGELEWAENFSNPVVSETYAPGPRGVPVVTSVRKDGTTTTEEVVPPINIPTLSGDHPYANAAINLTNAGININPVTGWYSASTGAWQAVLQGRASGGLSGAESYTSAIWQIASQGFGARYHGLVSFFWNLSTGVVNNWIQSGKPPEVHVTSNIGWHANAYIDPSGTVQTTRGVPVAGAKVTLSRSATRRGRQVRVPNGSQIMSPANRRNPVLTDALGLYGWDVVPGFYRIAAGHRGCTAPRGRGRLAASRVLAVPPPQTGIRLTLRCPRLRRARSGLRLAGRAAPTRYAPTALTATVLARRHGRPLGAVTFDVGRRRLGSAAVDPRTGRATLEVPSALRRGRAISATYGGDAAYAPARARARVR